MAEGSNFEMLEDLGIIGRDERGYTKRLILAKWYVKNICAGRNTQEKMRIDI